LGERTDVFSVFSFFRDSPGRSSGNITVPTPSSSSRLPKYLWLALGWICFALGVIGVVLPGLPTTGPMLLALACFSKGSDRLRNWLLEHRLFGPPLKRWHEERTIPFKAKVMALLMMTLSGAGILWMAPFPDWGKAAVLLLIVIGMAVVIRIPHETGR